MSRLTGTLTLTLLVLLTDPMAELTIVTGKEQAVLRTSSKKVKDFDALQSLIEDMKETLSGTENGIGLAAPQVGENIRLFIISPDFAEETGGKLVFLNPEITSFSRRVTEEEEGCLSLPETWDIVARANKVTIKAQDENGEKFKVTAKGLLARLFQHEVDHLNGTLFVDHVS